MSSRKDQLFDELAAALELHRKSTALPGLKSAASEQALLRQLVDSVRRIRFVTGLDPSKFSLERAAPSNDIFDPIRGAVFLRHNGDVDEAAWLVFLSTHFGKHRRQNWQLTRDVYGKLGTGDRWTWKNVCRDPRAFRDWLRINQPSLAGKHFGNHRKYQSIDADKPAGTGAAIESYVAWVGTSRSHAKLFGDALADAGGDNRGAFDRLYRSMEAVISFGRTARFDYLTMIGKTRIADIEPGSAYLSGATGPVRGGKLLFGASTTASMTRAELDRLMVELGDALGVGMQVIEDALCNWQKSPEAYVGFRG